MRWKKKKKHRSLLYPKISLIVNSFIPITRSRNSCSFLPISLFFKYFSILVRDLRNSLSPIISFSLSTKPILLSEKLSFSWFFLFYSFHKSHCRMISCHFLWNEFFIAFYVKNSLKISLYLFFSIVLPNIYISFTIKTSYFWFLKCIKLLYIDSSENLAKPYQSTAQCLKWYFFVGVLNINFLYQQFRAYPKLKFHKKGFKNFDDP